MFLHVPFIFAKTIPCENSEQTYHILRNHVHCAKKVRGDPANRTYGSLQAGFSAAPTLQDNSSAMGAAALAVCLPRRGEAEPLGGPHPQPLDAVIQAACLLV